MVQGPGSTTETARLVQQTVDHAAAVRPATAATMDLLHSTGVVSYAIIHAHRAQGLTQQIVSDAKMVQLLSLDQTEEQDRALVQVQTDG